MQQLRRLVYEEESNAATREILQKRDRFTFFTRGKRKILKVSKVNRLVDRHLKHLDVGTRRCVRILLSKSF